MTPQDQIKANIEKQRLSTPASEMTLLDEFAKAAMQGLLASDRMRLDAKDAVGAITRNSYRIAQAMLSERARIMEGEENTTRCQMVIHDGRCLGKKPCPIHDKNEV